ncbi:2-alkenal reductase (NADP(+)-dependent)-like [Vitis riparia]|uniref:2-alkenal reductase (NADP(+)-dependent)-like n=1 Tax=Vitis riparia TaxID=96939 RepID=UPI00155ABA53|nr:2-alkenal reductase (NADP(+)-dependent)-like [Vitis riparia]XP_034701468.1 2-alkenal reductase (NADP(+)-dependent)-like [Vitis riparia]
MAGLEGVDNGGDENLTMVESREWVMVAYAARGIPTSDHLKLRTTKLSLDADSIPKDHVAVELLWVSVDPYLRGRMSGQDEGLYFSQFALDEVITTCGIGRVIRSKSSRFSKGDLVSTSFFPFSEYCIIEATSLQVVDQTAGIEISTYLSALGVPGFAAWVAIEVIGNPKSGSNVFISAAAGGVGMFAGQLAKFKGCRVVGSTGTDEKVKLLKEEFGYDDAFNYNKETDFDAALSKYFPNGIDLYLDNVGGKMLEAVLNHVNARARIAVSGMISQYNQVWTEREGVRNLLNIVGKEVRIEGYLMGSHMDRFDDFTKAMVTYTKEGKLRSKHKIYYGIESFIESLGSIFSSSNIGKVVIQVKP